MSSAHRRYVGLAVAVPLALTLLTMGPHAFASDGTESPDTTPDTTVPVAVSTIVDAVVPTIPVPAPVDPTPTTATPATNTGTSLPAATTPSTALHPTPVPPAAPAATHVTVHPRQLGHILATIRYMESRGNYTVAPNRGNASGAYQFIESTWNGFGGYSHAYLAPSWVQDERAAQDVNRFLKQWNNDVSMIPVMWYYPRAATAPELMDVVPVPSAGNVLTIREYQQRWLAVFSFISGRPLPTTLTQADVYARAGLPPTVPPVDPAVTVAGQAKITFPVLGPTRVAAPDCEQPDAAAAGLCSPTAPGIVFGVKLQPVLAVHDGVVTGVVDTPGLPISVTVTDVTGRSYTLSGFNDDNPGTDDGAAPSHLRLTSLARIGGSVKAGQILGFMGDSEPLPLGVLHR